MPPGAMPDAGGAPPAGPPGGGAAGPPPMNPLQMLAGLAGKGRKRPKARAKRGGGRRKKK